MSRSLFFVLTRKTLFGSDGGHLGLLFVYFLGLGLLLVFTFGFFLAPSGEVTTPIQIVLGQSENFKSADHEVVL